MVEWNSGMTILNINKQFQGVGNREGGGGGKTHTMMPLMPVSHRIF